VLARQWESLTVEQCNSEILDATEKVRMKKQRTTRDDLIAKMGKAVLQQKKDSFAATSGLKKLADDPKNLHLDEFTDLDLIVCKTFNVITGVTIEFSLLDWVRLKLYKKLALCIHGGSNLGKTPLARSLVSEVAGVEQSIDTFPPYYIKVETVDLLREAVKVNLMRDNVPILFDEITPGKKRGSRHEMSLEDIKKMCEIVDNTGLDGRNDDIAFRDNQARVFTSNASCPHSWHYDLPRSVWNDSQEDRLKYSSDVLAVFKRVAFANVTHSVVSAENRARFERARMGNGADAVLNPQPQPQQPA